MSGAVPRLRFQEFEREWAAGTLADIIRSLDAGVSVNAGDRPARLGEKGVLKISAITSGLFDLTENKVISDSAELGRLRKPVRADTVLICRKNTAGLVGGSAFVSGSVSDLYLPDLLWATSTTEPNSTRWLSYLLSTPDTRARLSDRAAGTSGSMKGLSKAAVMSLPIHLPTPEEQRRIAAFLGAVDAKLDALGREREGLRRFKAGLAEALFTRALRFTRDDGSAFPDWEERPGTLGSVIVSLDAGVSVNSDDRPAGPGELGVLKTSCVTDGRFEAAENKVVSEEHEVARLSEPVRRGTIIISRMNTPALVAANAYVEEDHPNLFLPERLWSAKIAVDTDPQWVAHLLAYPATRAALTDRATGTSGSMEKPQQAVGPVAADPDPPPRRASPDRRRSRRARPPHRPHLARD